MIICRSQLCRLPLCSNGSGIILGLTNKRYAYTVLCAFANCLWRTANSPWGFLCLSNFFPPKVTALMGAHTLGAGHLENTGYDGLFMVNENLFFNNKYYGMMLDRNLKVVNQAKFTIYCDFLFASHLIHVLSAHFYFKGSLLLFKSIHF